MPKPIVAVGALGGTIAMSAPGMEAVKPELDAAALVASVPVLEDVAEIRSHSISNVPSPAIVPSNVLAALDFAREAVDSGADGVVLTHGTDTLEESAYFLDLLWDREEPLVLTGAMRSPNVPGADGPANLLASVVTASAPEARGMGVLVVLDDTVHLARLVTKSHATAVSAFQSPGWGPVGRIVERKLRLMLRPARVFDQLPVPDARDIGIPIVQSHLGDDGQWVKAIAASNPRALVIEASGAGHLSIPAADAVEELTREGLIVAMVTRTGSGSTTEHTYGYPGSEEDLIARGIIPGGFLNARRLRILLHVLLSSGMTHEQIRDEVRLRGE